MTLICMKMKLRAELIFILPDFIRWRPGYEYVNMGLATIGPHSHRDSYLVLHGMKSGNERFRTYTRFETEAKENSEMAYCKTWRNACNTAQLQGQIGHLQI